MINSLNVLNNSKVNFTGNHRRKPGESCKLSYNSITDINHGKLYNEHSLTGQALIAGHALSTLFSTNPCIYSAPVAEATDLKFNLLPKMLVNADSDYKYFMSRARDYSRLKDTINRTNPAFYEDENKKYVSMDAAVGVPNSRLYFSQTGVKARFSNEYEHINIPTRLFVGMEKGADGRIKSAKQMIDFENGVIYEDIKFGKNGNRIGRMAIVEPQEACNPYIKFARSLDRNVVLNNVYVEHSGVISADSMSLIKTSISDKVEEIKTYVRPEIHQQVEMYSFYNNPIEPIMFTILSDATYDFKCTNNYKRAGVFETQTSETVDGKKYSSTSKAVLVPLSKNVTAAYANYRVQDNKVKYDEKSIISEKI